MTATTVRHAKRGTVIPVRHDGVKLVGIEEPLVRFAKYCRFDAATGCVVWVGGTTQGRGHSSPYGSFWYAGRRWFAHRWAAKFIHGLDIEDMQVDHCCPHHPNTLCVEHVQAITPAANRELQTRRYWVFVTKGLEPPPSFWLPPEPEEQQIPFFTPPEWYRQAKPSEFAAKATCPF